MYLKHINLVNFQSWEDLTIDLTGGLNVIVADNGVGKSVIFKALEFVLNPYKFTKSQWSDFIRYDSAEAIISLVFSDDSGYIINLTRNNVYYTKVTDLTGEPRFEALGEVPPSDIADNLGSVIKNDVISNFISMDGTKFLVNSDYDTNHSLLSLTINDEELDHLIETLETVFIPNNKSLQKEVNQKLSFLTQTLSSIKKVDCVVRRQNVEFSASLIVLLSPLLDMREDFKRIESVVDLPTEVEKLFEFSKKLDSVVRDLQRLNQVPNNPDDLIRDYNLTLAVTNFVEELKGFRNIPSVAVVGDNLKLYNDCLEINNLKELLDSVNHVVIGENTDKLFSDSLIIYDVLNELGESLTEVSVLKSELSQLENTLNNLGGKEYECPIHGNILYVQGECIPNPIRQS